MKKIYLAFLWHQHQPSYKNPSTGYYELPWVRLHAVKDYYDMVAALDNFPKVKANFNLVPSLITQLEEYASGQAKDIFIDLTLKEAELLNEDEKVFILLNFFMANWETMVFPYNRYLQLLEKRGKNTTEAEIRDTLSYFKPEDFRDLQVWFNLCWMDPYWRKNDLLVSYLYDKERDFTEEDKKMLVAKHLEICGKIIQKHKEAQDRGQIEVSVTPFYHPILPLLCDTNSALQSAPNMQLPAMRFTHREDAAKQIFDAVECYERNFGHKPKGMWPSEGSVSNDAIDLMSQNGIKWVATDEAVLFNSSKHLERKALFRPFKTRGINILFRDHGLSDSIGFVYSKWNPEDAVNDLITKIQNIGNFVGDDYYAPLISIVLDGENCWEYYQNDGWDFLTKLYEKLSENEQIETVRISDYLEQFPPLESIDDITAGSWINGNFYVWIGQHEDNISWDALSQTRDFLTQHLDNNPDLKDSENAKKAWKLLYAAEGSDWNWWYGDDHSSSNDAMFDYLYRKHLIEIYLLFGQTPPTLLYSPIKKSVAKKYFAIKPTGLISPDIDGKKDNFHRWDRGGCYKVGHSGGSMHQVSSVLSAFYYGFDKQNFYIMFDVNDDISSKTIEDLMFNLVFTMPVKNIISLNFDSSGKPVRFTITNETGEEVRMDLAHAAFEKAVQAKVSFQSLNFPQEYENMSFYVSVSKNNLEIEKWPANEQVLAPRPA